MQHTWGFIQQRTDSFRTDWSEHISQADRLNIFLAASSLGIICLIGVMVYGTIDTAHKLLYYASGLATGMIAALGACAALVRFRLRANAKYYSYLYESLLIYNSVYMLFGALIYTIPFDEITPLQTLVFIVAPVISNWLIASQAVSLSWQTTDPATLPKKLGGFMRLTAIAVCIVVGLTLIPALANGAYSTGKLIVFGVSSVLLVIVPSRLFRRAYLFLPWIWAILITLFMAEIFLPQYALALAAAAVALVSLRVAPEKGGEPDAALARPGWRDLIALVVILALTVDVHFPHDRHHFNSYLGAVNDMLHGKTLLVDSMCQYGWLLVYALAGVFSTHLIPISYPGFSLIISLVIGFAMSILYLSLRLTVRSLLMPLLAIVIVIVAFDWHSNLAVTLFPNLGPLRFICLYALMGVWCWGYYKPGSRRWLVFIRHLALIAGVMWSFESAFFCLVLHTALSGFEILVSKGNTGRQILRQIVLICIDIAIAVAVIYASTYLKSGQLPDWRSNFELLIYYPTNSEIYQVPYFFFSMWPFIAGIYLVSILLITLKWLGAADRQEAARYILPFGITVLGFLQLAYWVSNPNIRITTQFAPPIILTVFWYSEFKSGNFQNNVRQGVGFFIRLFALFYLMSGVYMLAVPTTYSVVHAAVSPIVSAVTHEPSWNLAEQWNKPPTMVYIYPGLWEDRSTVAPAVTLIRQYAPDKDRVALLIPPDSTVETFMIVNRANIYKLDNAINDTLAPASTERALLPISDLQPGDIVFVAQDFNLLLPLQQALVRNLCQQFRLKPVEILQGVAALELANLPGQSGDCTCQTSQLMCPAQ